MTIQQLKYILAIADTGSLNKAAEIMYVSQPSLTGMLKDIEREFNIRIFNRSGRGAVLTPDGVEFVQYARRAVQQFDELSERFGKGGALKKKFGVSSQHYSFAVKSFVETVKSFDTREYEFALRETRTAEVIEDVASGKSEIGLLYLNDFNRAALEKIFRSNDLAFHPLIDCDAYVYLWNGHPLAKEPFITFDMLRPYPNLSFEQGGSGSFYSAEEILPTKEYPRTIKAADRATMLNLMVGLDGYTLCSGIICEELNGSDYSAVPFRGEDEGGEDKMEIGYIVKKNTVPTEIGKLFIEELEKYLSEC